MWFLQKLLNHEGEKELRIFLYFYFLVLGIKTQDLVLARQVLMSLSYMPSLS